MRYVLHGLGIGTALIAASACAGAPGTPLAAAAAANDHAGVRRLLAAGHAADESADAGWPVRGTADGSLTPLMWAARRGALDAMAVLLDAGADIDARDTRYGWTPLQHAIHTRHVDALRLLLDRGADANRSARAGRLTPLLMAAGDRDPSAVTLLLRHGADPHAAGEDGDTPLSRAVSGGALTDIDAPLFGGCHPATVRALLAHDPALRLPDNFYGCQALWWARFHHCTEVLAMVEERDKGN
jgi:ankyrin repeat protein